MRYPGPDGSRICFRTNNLASYLLSELSRMYNVREDEVLQSALDLLLTDPHFRSRIIEHVFRSREFEERLRSGP
jgi:hypothetical protein